MDPQRRNDWRRWIDALPKVETHVHLEGTIEPSALMELARKHHMASRDMDVKAIQRRYHYDGFREFINIYLWVVSHLRGPEDYALAASHFVRRLMAQRVGHVEVILSAGMMIDRGLPIGEILHAVNEVFARARSDGGPSFGFLFDITRQFGVRKGEAVLRAAKECAHRGVLGIGLGGDEAAGPAALFEGLFREAAQDRLRRVAHAGEWAGPFSIRDALEKLGVERIGHGVAAREDPGLMSVLVRSQVGVECCPTSNVKTGAIASLADHPLRRFLEAGMRVSLHSDDPPLFHTDLSGELMTALECLGLGPEAILQCQRNAIESSFASPERKDQLREALAGATDSPPSSM